MERGALTLFTTTGNPVRASLVIAVIFETFMVACSAPPVNPMVALNVTNPFVREMEGPLMDVAKPGR